MTKWAEGGFVHSLDLALPILISGSFWLVPQEIRLAGMTSTSMVQVALVILLALQARTLTGVGGRFQRQTLIAFGFFLLASIMAYFTNHSRVGDQLTFMAGQGFQVQLLYEKMVVVAVLAIFTCGAALVHGSSIAQSDHRIDQFFSWFIALGLLAAMINLGAWFFDTGGVIARYNYIPPITNSSGVTQMRMWVLLVIAFGRRLDPNVNRSVKRLCTWTILVSVLNIVTIVTRMGWINAGVALLLLVYLLRPYLPPRLARTLPIAVVVSISLAVVLIALNFGNEFSSAYQTLASDAVVGEDSTLNRFILLDHAMAMINANPILGIGYGQFALYSTIPMVVSGQEIYVASAHNGLIMVLCECGVVGLVIFSFINVRIIGLFGLKFKSLTGPGHQILIRTMFPIMVISVFGQFFSNSDLTPLPVEASSIQHCILLWTLIGICSGLPDRKRPLIADGKGTINPRQHASI